MDSLDIAAVIAVSALFLLLVFIVLVGYRHDRRMAQRGGSAVAPGAVVFSGDGGASCGDGGGSC